MSRPIGSKNKPKTAIVPQGDTIPLVLDSVKPQDIIESITPTLEGWANLCNSTFSVLGKKMVGYYLGGDIHPTVEDAKKAAGATVVGQVYIRWCDTRKVKGSAATSAQSEVKYEDNTPNTIEE